MLDKIVRKKIAIAEGREYPEEKNIDMSDFIIYRQLSIDILTFSEKWESLGKVLIKNSLAEDIIPSIIKNRKEDFILIFPIYMAKKFGKYYKYAFMADFPIAREISDIELDHSDINPNIVKPTEIPISFDIFCPPNYCILSLKDGKEKYYFRMLENVRYMGIP